MDRKQRQRDRATDRETETEKHTHTETRTWGQEQNVTKGMHAQVSDFLSADPTCESFQHFKIPPLTGDLGYQHLSLCETFHIQSIAGAWQIPEGISCKEKQGQLQAACGIMEHTLA